MTCNSVIKTINLVFIRDAPKSKLLAEAETEQNKPNTAFCDFNNYSVTATSLSRSVIFASF